MSTDTFQIGGSGNAAIATQVVSANSGPHLIMNLDLHNPVFIGDDPGIIANFPSGVIPIAPNGSYAVSGDYDVYAVTAPGISVEVGTLLGGMSSFLGLTQSLGMLAIPSIRSPDFVSGISGWIISQDGSAQFNNVTIRGNLALSEVWLAPSGDTTGVTDLANITAAFVTYSTVHLAAGTWFINSTIVVPGDHVLTGPPSAVNTTPGASNVMPVIIKLVANSNAHMIIAGGNDVYVGNMELNGQRSLQTSGFGNGILYDNQFFGIFERLFIHDQFFRGIDMVNGSAAQVIGCSITGNNDMGIFLDSSSNDVHIHDCQIARNGNDGLNMAGFVSHINDNDIFNNTNNGIKVVGGRGHLIRGNGIDHNGQHGVVITTGPVGSCSIVGNTFHSNGQNATATFDDVHIDNSASNIDGIAVDSNGFWLDGGITNKTNWHIFHGGVAVTRTHSNQFQAASSVAGNINIASQAKDANETG